MVNNKKGNLWLLISLWVACIIMSTVVYVALYDKTHDYFIAIISTVGIAVFACACVWQIFSQLENMVPKSERERIKAEKLAEEARKKQLAEVQSHEVTRPEPQQPQIVVQNTIVNQHEIINEVNTEALITCTKTNRAYERLIQGDADIIFVAQPSDEELDMAAEEGVEFDMIPIGREAFVFIVNKDNPLDSITVDQIKGVYSGQITDWSQLGVQGIGPIVAYQRPKNSGSQTALKALMGDTPLMEAPKGVVAWDMGDILDTVEYRNLPNAIGYSFRFFCTDMMGSEVKLLAVDGVEPTEANIRNGSYPITSTVYAIRLKGNDNPNVVALLDWIKSPQGMELVEKSGYTPWEG